MFLRFVLVFIIITSCGLSPGFQKEPTSKNPKEMGLERNGVTLYFYNLNKMNIASLPKVEEVQKKSQKKLSKLIKNDKYYYSIGAGYTGFLWPLFIDQAKKTNFESAWKNLIKVLKFQNL